MIDEHKRTKEVWRSKNFPFLPSSWYISQSSPLKGMPTKCWEVYWRTPMALTMILIGNNTTVLSEGFEERPLCGMWESKVLPSLENQLKSSRLFGIRREWLKTFELHHTQVKSCQKEFKTLYPFECLQSFGSYSDLIEVSDLKDKEVFHFTSVFIDRYALITASF